MIVSTITFVGILLFGKDITYMWLGDADYFNYGVAISLGLYGMSLSVIHVSVALANATGNIQKMPYIAILEATLNLILSLIFCRYLGIIGVAMGTLCASIMTSFWLIPTLCLRPVFPKLKSLYGFCFKIFFSISFPTMSVICFIFYLINKYEYLLIYKILALCIFIIINIFIIMTFRSQLKDHSVRLYDNV